MKTIVFALLAMLITPPDSEAKSPKAVKRGVASEASRSKGGKLHIMALDPDFPFEELTDEELMELDNPNPRQKGGLPPLVVQHQLLRQAGLAEVINWDPVEHDLFFGITGESDWEYVMRKYGAKFPEKRLRKLRELIRKYHAEEDK